MKWAGYNVNLKPAHEPVVVARKPLAGTVAANVLEFGTGALNVDGTRVGTGGEEVKVGLANPANRTGVVGAAWQAPSDAERNQRAQRESVARTNELGRWPPNVLLGCTCAEVLPGEPDERRERVDEPSQETRYDGEGGTNLAALPGARRVGGTADVHPDPDCPAARLDAQTGTQRGAAAKASGATLTGASTSNSRGRFNGVEDTPFYGDKGGASRFFPRFPLEDPDWDGDRFLYQAKAAKKEREAGLEDLPLGLLHRTNAGGYEADPKWEPKARRNQHPTVKPVALMRWLVRLVTPPGGVVLDPFLGSGTTGIAAGLEGFDFVGVEREAEYVELAAARIGHWVPDALVVVDRPAVAEEVA